MLRQAQHERLPDSVSETHPITLSPSKGAPCPLRVAITTLGCKVNQYDTATIEDRLRTEGHTLVPFTNTADVLTEATAEFAFFILGAVARKLWPSERLVREKKWRLVISIAIPW